MTIQDFIDEKRSKAKKPKADINERWVKRVVARGLQNLGAAGADDYISAYGKGIAAPKVVDLALKAESESATAMANRFWEIAFNLATGITASAGNTGVSNAPKGATVAKPALPMIVGLESALQPGNITTMQADDASKPQSAYVTNSAYWGEPKRDGKRVLTVATGESVVYQARSLNTMKVIDSRLDSAMVDAAKIVGTFVLDGEQVYLDADGGEHRTESQAAQVNIDLDKGTERPVLLYSAFKALFADGKSLLDNDEGARIDAAANIVPYIEAALADTAPDGTVRIEMIPVARTTAEKQALCDKQKAENREGEIWIRHATSYLPGKNKGEAIVRTKYLTELDLIITGLTPTTAAGRPFGALELSKRNDDGSLTAMGSAGTGFDAETAKEIFKRHTDSPGTVTVTIRSQGLTENGKLWHGRFVGFVETK